jgi:uncharacterized membrane protein YagU involved in acid resistance
VENPKRNLTRNEITIAEGAAAGFIATFPMTLVMVLLHRLLPWWERYPLPPRQITEEVTRRAGAREHMDEPQRRAATLLMHFGFGAAAGALYVPLASRLNLPIVLRGVIFGMMVWTGSYLGWLPAARVLPPATEHPTRRTLLMTVAHLVWGSALALIAHNLGAITSSSALTVRIPPPSRERSPALSSTEIR